MGLDFQEEVPGVAEIIYSRVAEIIYFRVAEIIYTRVAEIAYTWVAEILHTLLQRQHSLLCTQATVSVL